MKITIPKKMVEKLVKDFGQIQECVENLYSSIDSVLKLEEFFRLGAKIVVEGIHRDSLLGYTELSKMIGVSVDPCALIVTLSYSDKLSPDPQEFEINLMKKNINYEEELLKGIWQKN